MIYPVYFPASRNNEFAEKKVFAALENLKNKFDIFYHKKLVDFQRIPCEIDFVIMDRNKSILLMEVKGGPITFKDGVWRSYETVIDPLEQIEKSKRKFINKYWLSNNILVDHCLCFPDSDLDSYPDSVLEYQIITKSHFHNLEEVLKTSFKKSRAHLAKTLVHTPEILSTGDYSRILKKIEGQVKYHIPLSAKVELEDNRIKELTEGQYSVYECCMENNRIIVNGVAGSGKTILALKIAKEYYEDGANVLFLCYNIMLGQTLKNECDAIKKKSKRPDNCLIADDCHGFLGEVIKDKGIYDFIGPKSTREEKNLFYEMEVPIKMEEEIESGLIASGVYDILIIDEAQDFNEYMLAPLFHLVKPDGKIILLKDDRQILFNQNLIPDFDSFFKLRLNKNLRNTKVILKYINNKLQLDLFINKENPDGEPVVEKIFKDNAALLNEMSLKINQLVKNEKIDPNDITIIYPEKLREEHCLHQIEKIGSLDLMELTDSLVRKKNTIYKTRITKFKGLDSGFLFLPNIELFTIGSIEDNYIYTVLTRARNRLYVYEVEKNKP